MAELGSVFEDEDPGRPRGPDLRVTMEVPRAALGAEFEAPVPTRIAAEGELVERVILNEDAAEGVSLHLPDELPGRTMLRLRGQGGVAPEPEGRPGDLLVLVELVDRPPRDDEIIRRAPLPVAAAGSPIPELGDARDLTVWVLVILALVGGGVLAALALQ